MLSGVYSVNFKIEKKNKVKYYRMVDPLLEKIDELPISNYVKNHYKKCVGEGGLCRRGIEFAVKVFTLRPRKK